MLANSPGIGDIRSNPPRLVLCEVVHHVMTNETSTDAPLMHVNAGLFLRAHNVFVRKWTSKEVASGPAARFP